MSCSYRGAICGFWLRNVENVVTCDKASSSQFSISPQFTQCIRLRTVWQSPFVNSVFPITRHSDVYAVECPFDDWTWYPLWRLGLLQHTDWRFACCEMLAPCLLWCFKIALPSSAELSSRGRFYLAHGVVTVWHLRWRHNDYSYLTLRSLTLYIYGAPILDVSRSHTTTQHSR